MDKVDVIILMWFCFLFGVVIDSWVSLTQQLWRELCQSKSIILKKKDEKLAENNTENTIIKDQEKVVQ